jgi:hypothetical protein
MGANSKTKQLQKYLLLRTMILRDNMTQWAKADEFLGMEHMFRNEEVAAIQAGDTGKTVEIHNKRIDCLKAATEILEICPACGPHEHKKEE